MSELSRMLSSLVRQTGGLQPAAKVLCVGAGPEAEQFVRALRETPLDVRSAGGCADAVRALACREFVAVVVASEVRAPEVEQMRALFEQAAPGRTPPVWLRLQAEGAAAAVPGHEAIAFAPAEAVRHMGRSVRADKLRRQFLDTVRLELLEETEVACGEFLAEAFSLYVHRSDSLVAAIQEAHRAGDGARLADRSQALASMAGEMADLRTTAGARLLNHAAQAGHGVPQAAIDDLGRARVIGVESLRLYLSAGAVKESAKRFADDTGDWLMVGLKPRP